MACKKNCPKSNLPDYIKFSNTGDITSSNSGNMFVDLSYSLPFNLSSADSYITSLISKQLIDNKPTYFQIPYIYSASYNIFKGNFTSNTKTEDQEIITTYIVPYDGELKLEYATFITIYNTNTKILFFEIPNVFSYNSLMKASIAVNKQNDGTFIGKINIPPSFIKKNIIKTSSGFILPFTIKPDLTTLNPENNTLTSNLKMEVKASTAFCCQTPSYGQSCCNTVFGIPTCCDNWGV